MLYATPQVLEGSPCHWEDEVCGLLSPSGGLWSPVSFRRSVVSFRREGPEVMQRSTRHWHFITNRGDITDAPVGEGLRGRLKHRGSPFLSATPAQSRRGSWRDGREARRAPLGADGGRNGNMGRGGVPVASKLGLALDSKLPASARTLTESLFGRRRFAPPATINALQCFHIP
ncbi:unnamed protein product [Boreogadus saida]